MYRSDETAAQIVADYSSAPIPEIHKTVFSWSERFTRSSWDFAESDLRSLRAAGVRDNDIVGWAQRASVQTYLVMNADGGGVELDSQQSKGQAIGRTRDAYHEAKAGLTGASVAAQPARRPTPSHGVAWVETDTESAVYRETAEWARERYGFSPNLFAAESLNPLHYELHREAFELLEGPQSKTLSPRRHAMVRALVSNLNRSAYSAHTTRRLLFEQSDGDHSLVDAVTGDYTKCDLEPVDKLVLDFAAKVARNSYKIVAEDAEAFRAAGLGDEGYVDVLSTTSIQTSLDRLANALGVTPDDEPVLPLRREAFSGAVGGA